METKTEEATEEKTIAPEPKRSYWEFGLFIVIAATLVAVISVLGFLLVKTLSKQEAEKVSIQTIAKEAGQENKVENKVVPSDPVKKDLPPAAKETNPLEVSIKILNGGAPGGSAGIAKGVLAAKGYKKIEAGNSEKSSYAGTTVFYQADMKTVAEKVVADLKAKYPAAQAKAGVSAEEKSGPIVIILGK